MFIGRQEELKFLENRYVAKHGQLIVLYGRRRIGKTETLRKFAEGKEHVFYSCAEVTDDQQLIEFSNRVLLKGIPASQYIKSFPDWTQALQSITELPGNSKKLLIIDEFPYMVKNNPSIPSILQNLWDTTLKDKNVMLVLCGSAMSFIENEILAEKNPLYGRATGIIKMNAMDFYDAIQFVPNYNALDQITTYAVLGGIPHYLKQFNDNQSLGDNISRNILSRGSILYSEVEFLMKQEFRETATYNAIIGAVALGNTKLNDIHLKTQIEKSKLSVYLKTLIDLGILSREFPISSGVKEQANINRGLYRVSDNYFRFWYAFVFPNLSELESGDAKGIWQYVVKPELDRYTSLAFEDICIQYLRKENRNNNLPFRFTKIGRWWSKTDELDILATDQKYDNYILGECKYKNSPFSLSDLKHMQGKFNPKSKDSTLNYWLFSKSGFTNDIFNSGNNESIYTVTPEQLVSTPTYSDLI